MSQSANQRTAHLSSAAPVGLDVAALFRAHERAVMRWAARLGGPGIDVEDVVQDVFLVAQRRLPSFVAADAKVTTWLFRTTEKIVLAARRKQRLRRWLSRSADAAVTTMGARRPTPGEALERDRDIAVVYRVLDRVSERHRRLLVLFEIEELSTEEIAAVTGMRLGAVRVGLFRARASFLKQHQRLLGAQTPAEEEHTS